MAKSNGRNKEFIESLLKRGYTQNPDGSLAPPKIKSAFINDLKERQTGKVAIKQIVTPSDDFVVAGAYPVTLVVIPMGKPRMTQRDKWLKPPRKPIKSYWEYKDALAKEAALKRFKMPESNFHVTFVLPMPHSWTSKKRAMMIDSPHQQKPDNDNLMKAFKDCLCEEDSNIWDYRITKLWGLSGKIIINELR
jgi:Holliday junction resolvase RusA-like endonuclease